MKNPLHLFRLSPAQTGRDHETIHFAARNDVQWNTAIFKAPTLPTLRQLHGEIPFSANFRLKNRPTR
jgi:hypothetical protein